MERATKTSIRFYADLPPIADFAGISESAAFRTAPDDWTVVVADIVGSTKAVAEGRYKHVNMVGAACITAAANAYCEAAIAFVFGGDGATLLLPPDALVPVFRALRGLQSRSEQVFGLKVRVGAVPVADIRRRGRDIRVAKLELSPGNYQALFAGGGVALADELVKSPESGPRYEINAGADEAALDLSNLSCRWQKLAPRAGTMIALLVSARGANQMVRNANFAVALKRINRVVGDFRTHAPANGYSLSFVWPPRGTMLEARICDGRVRAKRVARILFQSAFQWLGHRLGRKYGDYDAPLYAEELKANTDFQRFDDMIRLVLDCSTNEVQALRAALGQLETAGIIDFGLYAASAGLMTCLVFDLAAGHHIHFVDADEGGFTLAARELKAKWKRRAATQPPVPMSETIAAAGRANGVPEVPPVPAAVLVAEREKATTVRMDG
ncbi:MAG: DUF3095 family protein [Hyphomicrobiales bacterium]|nr:DUF3095 family protein [Hyphomicrobiales bacterium]